jgi:hypothetical protein
MRTVMLVMSSILCAACIARTGGSTIELPVAAAGPAVATAGQPLSFTSGPWKVVLTRATLHVGAVYLDQTAPVSGGQATGCYLTGTYLAQETSSLDVDLLNPTPQAFAARALAITAPPALVGQVWLTGGDINTVSDPTPILVIAGTASGAGGVFPFAGTITIGANRQVSGGGSGAGGGDPICKQRIVTPIPAALTIEETGGLLLRIDPRLYFTAIDFSQLPKGASTGSYEFSDDPTATGYFPTGLDLFSNLESTAPYTFSWSDDL